jgi:hypothetical protein
MTVLTLPSLPTTCWASTGKVCHFAQRRIGCERSREMVAHELATTGTRLKCQGRAR